MHSLIIISSLFTNGNGAFEVLCSLLKRQTQIISLKKGKISIDFLVVEFSDKLWHLSIRMSPAFELKGIMPGRKKFSKHGRTQGFRWEGSCCVQVDQNVLGQSQNPARGSGGMLPRKNFGKMEPNPAILPVLAVKTERLQNGLLTKMILKTIKKKFWSVERTFCGRAGGFFRTPWTPLGYGPGKHSLTPGVCVCGAPITAVAQSLKLVQISQTGELRPTWGTDLSS